MCIVYECVECQDILIQRKAKLINETSKWAQTHQCEQLTHHTCINHTVIETHDKPNTSTSYLGNVQRIRKYRILKSSHFFLIQRQRLVDQEWGNTASTQLISSINCGLFKGFPMKVKYGGILNIEYWLPTFNSKRTTDKKKKEHNLASGNDNICRLLLAKDVKLFSTI